MYQDPTLKREHVVKLRFSDHEARLIDALVNYTGEQKASLLRDLVLSQAADVLGAEIAPAPAFTEGAGCARLGVQRKAS